MKTIQSARAGTAGVFLGAVILLVSSLVGGGGNALAGDLVSERGKVALNASSADIAPVKPRKIFARPARPWASAPPTIPHNSKGYKISPQYNTCMSCHVRNYQRMKAPKAPVSHFITYSGVLDHNRLDRRRYFCTQCHAPQADIPPLVKNTYTNAAHIKLPADPKHAALVAEGKGLVEDAGCTGCHQPGETVDNIRYLEGWEAEALVNVLKAYKRGDIQNEDMSAVTEDMKEKEMKAIGAYLSSLSAFDK